MNNVSVVLDKRPTSAEVADCFVCVHGSVPEPRESEMLLETLWLSIEPYMMLAMSGHVARGPGRSVERSKMLTSVYATGVELGAVMCGPVVSRVVQSRVPGFSEGDIVSAWSGWQAYAIDDGSVARKIRPSTLPLQTHLGVLGIPGMTGYTGMKAIGQPKSGETVVVSAAMGAVGIVAAGVARMHGARTVGIAGGIDKCRSLVETLGFDAAVDRHDADFPQRLAEACPRGIDVYFENVGGAVWQAVFPLLRFFARVPICGLIANYAPSDAHAERDRVPEVMKKAMLYRLTIRGFAVFDHFDLENDFLADTTSWIEQGKLPYVEAVYDTLEQAPRALQDLLNGRTVGKTVVRVARE